MWYSGSSTPGGKGWSGSIGRGGGESGKGGGGSSGGGGGGGGIGGSGGAVSSLSNPEKKVEVATEGVGMALMSMSPAKISFINSTEKRLTLPGGKKFKRIYQIMRNVFCFITRVIIFSCWALLA